MSPAVCGREKVSVANHTNAFTARSGAPRKDLYRDQLCPSHSGMSRLVSYLQLGTGTPPHPAQKEHQTFNSSRRNSMGSNTLIQPSLRCWDLRCPGLFQTDSTTGQLTGSLHVSDRERRHHSILWYTCTYLHIVTDLPLHCTDAGPHRPQSTATCLSLCTSGLLPSRDTLLRSMLRDSGVKTVRL